MEYIMGNTTEQLLAEMAALKAEIAERKAEIAKYEADRKLNDKLSLRVSTKGAVSVYGLGRWPVTLYKGQWPRLLAIKGEIEAFLVAHDKELTAEKPSAEIMAARALAQKAQADAAKKP
jgi:hypothetical protein